jgi:hypothetical protein
MNTHALARRVSRRIARPIPRRAALAPVFALLLLAGCGDDDAAAPSPETDLAVAADESDTIEVSLVDYAFGGLPTSMAAGTRLSVINEAEEELHEVVAFRLPDGEDRNVADLLRLTPEELGSVLGEPTTVLLAEPGGPQIDAVGDGTLADPGRYALVCFIPVGADRQEYLAAAAEGDGPPQVAGGPPHFVEGMYAEVVVE